MADEYDRDVIGDAQRRLLESVPADLDAEGEPDPAESVVLDALEEEGWTILGTGISRAVGIPPNGVAPDGVVIKLSRPTTPDTVESQTGWGQNKAEEHVWESVSAGEVDGVQAAWFAPVLATGDVDVFGVTYDDAWLAMERATPVRDLDRGEEYAEACENAVSARFLECVMRPDIGPGNIALPDDADVPEEPSPDSPLVLIDYGMPNWITEEGLH